MEEKIDLMRDGDLSPEKLIALMFDRTNEDGILYVPALFYYPAGWEYGVPETHEDESYRCKMNWNVFKYEKTLEKFKKHLDNIERIGKMGEDARNNDKELILTGELLEFFNKFLAPYNTGEFDEDKISDIEDRLDIIAWVKYIAKKLASGQDVDGDDRKSLAENADVVVSKEEQEYYDLYCDTVLKDVENRVGNRPFARKVLFFSWRLYKVLELNAPQIIIKNEMRSLAQAYVLYECCDFYEVVDNCIRLRIEQIENMSEEELDDFYRPQKMNSRKSLAPLFVYSILKDKSSSKKHLRQQEIINELSKHPYEIFIERKALSRIIHNLVDSAQYAVFQDKTGVWIDQEK